MMPIQFSCEETLPIPAEKIAEQMLDLAKWPEFEGCWPIPGIKQAEFEVRTPEIIGTRIRVTNLDGSSHAEEIVQWEPGRILQLRMQDFSAPLASLAEGFEETWTFEPADAGTRVVRSFQLHPKSIWAKIPLKLIARFLRKAIARHLRQMKKEAQASESASP